MGVFELAEARGQDSIAVRAFTPTLASEGYASVGSIVETNTRDSPFLVDSVSEEIAAHGLSVRLVLHPVVGIERDDARADRRRQAGEGRNRRGVRHAFRGRPSTRRRGARRSWQPT